MLYLVEYADYDSQEMLGVGNSYHSGTLGVSPSKSGECNSLGMKSGTLNNDGKHSMIYRVIEDIVGNADQFIDGINLKDYKRTLIIIQIHMRSISLVVIIIF